MNEKKAKEMRSFVCTEVQVQQETVYKPYKKITYTKVTDPDGIEHLMKVKGIPRVLDVCARSVYQEMKKNSK